MFSPGINTFWSGLLSSKLLAVPFITIKQDDEHHVLVRQIKGFLIKNSEWFSIIDVFCLTNLCRAPTQICLYLFFFLARLLILIKKGGLLQLKFGGVGVNIYLWAR